MVKTFHFVGCGTAYHAGVYASLLCNRFGIASRAWIASELPYSHPVFDPSDAFVFVSQSGETADSIKALREIKVKGNICLGLVNVPGSTISVETDAGVYIRAGLEKGVASTKAYTAQLVTSALLVLFLARQRKMTIDTGVRIISELEKIPQMVAEVLKTAPQIKKLAEKYKDYKNYYFLGRYFSLVTAMEGSLKLKEISYRHAEAYPLGEMKHGPLALVSPDFVSFVTIPNDSLIEKGRVNIGEIKARSGPVIAVTNSGVHMDNVDDILTIPVCSDFFSPILASVVTQLYAYYTAVILDRNPDKPRNLAKSVTVE